MSSMRPMKALDLLHFESVNLDPLTETYNIGFYLEYLAKWPTLCQVMVSRDDQIEGYILGKLESSPHGQPSQVPYSPDTNKNMNYLPWHAHVTALTVAPACRRIGHARKLTALLEQQGEKENCWFVDLFVRMDNVSAIGMYRGMGYSVFRTVKNYYADGEDAYDMRKPLPRDKKRQTIRENGETFTVEPHDVWEECSCTSCEIKGSKWNREGKGEDHSATRTIRQRYMENSSNSSYRNEHKNLYIMTEIGDKMKRNSLDDFGSPPPYSAESSWTLPSYASRSSVSTQGRDSRYSPITNTSRHNPLTQGESIHFHEPFQFQSTAASEDIPLYGSPENPESETTIIAPMSNSKKKNLARRARKAEAKSSESSIEEPVERPVVASVKDSVEASVEQPVVASVEDPVTSVFSQPVEASDEELVAVHVEEFLEASVEQSVEMSVEEPGQATAGRPDEDPRGDDSVTLFRVPANDNFGALLGNFVGQPTSQNIEDSTDELLKNPEVKSDAQSSKIYFESDDDTEVDLRLPDFSNNAWMEPVEATHSNELSPLASVLRVGINRDDAPPTDSEQREAATPAQLPPVNTDQSDRTVSSDDSPLKADQPENNDLIHDYRSPITSYVEADLIDTSNSTYDEAQTTQAASTALQAGNFSSTGKITFGSPTSELQLLVNSNTDIISTDHKSINDDIVPTHTGPCVDFRESHPCGDERGADGSLAGNIHIMTLMQNLATKDQAAAQLAQLEKITTILEQLLAAGIRMHDKTNRQDGIQHLHDSAVDNMGTDTVQGSDDPSIAYVESVVNTWKHDEVRRVVPGRKPSSAPDECMSFLSQEKIPAPIQ